MTLVQPEQHPDLVYRACSIKRDRRTRAEVQAIRETIKSILSADHPQTVRQVFYQLVTRGAIEKTENEYQATVIRLLSEMRLTGEIRWSWIVDESRRTRFTQTFDNIGDALRDTAKYYRRSALHDCDSYIEIWSEKEALAGIIYEAASDYDVPVIVSKGMPSLTQVYGSFCSIKLAARAGKDSHIYQFGDHDPTGCLIPKTIESRLYEFCEKHNCAPPTVERIALTEEHISEYKLPTRPTKRDGNTHAHKFEGDSVELDALPSGELRELVRDCIERHINLAALETLREAEQSEREILEQLADEHDHE
jgi:DNA topoisomerase VI subunit A